MTQKLSSSQKFSAFESAVEYKTMYDLYAAVNSLEYVLYSGIKRCPKAFEPKVQNVIKRLETIKYNLPSIPE